MSEDDADWQNVSYKRRRSNTDSPKPSQKNQKTSELPSTSTNANRYTSLSIDDEDDNAPQPQENAAPKPPPIIIPGVENIAKMIKDITSIIPSNTCTYKALRDGQIRLMIDNIEGYRKIIKHLDNKKTLYHTYQPKQERAYRVVVRNLHPSTPIDEIKLGLLDYGHDARNIFNIQNRMTKEPLPIFFVDLEPKTNNKDVYKITSINYAIVKIEPPINKHNKEIVQCHRCQEFGHTKSYCRKSFRCVKCGQCHQSTICNKPLEILPSCVHCHGNHTASYKGCAVYQELIAKKNNMLHRISYSRTNNINFTNPEFNNNGNNTNFTNNNTTYANVAKSQFDNSNQNNMFAKIENLINKQTELVNSLISMMSSLLAKLCN